MNFSSGATGRLVVEMRSFDPDMISHLFTRVDMDWSCDARAEFVVSPLGEMSLVRSRHNADKSKSRRLERHIEDGEEETYFACLPLRGGMEITHLSSPLRQRRCCQVGSQQLTLLNTREEYEISMSDELDAIWLRVPGKLLRSHVLSADAAVGCPVDVKDGLGSFAKSMMRSALGQGECLNARGAKVFSQSLLSFLSEVIDSRLSAEQSASTRGRRKILQRAQAYIEEHLDDDELSPQAIAQGVGISTRYLSEIFAAEGCSPMRWVRNRRLELCRMELEKRRGGHQLVSEVAYSMGFTNVSSFNRAFKAHFGHAPREFLSKH